MNVYVTLVLIGDYDDRDIIIIYAGLNRFQAEGLAKSYVSPDEAYLPLRSVWVETWLNGEKVTTTSIK